MTAKNQPLDNHNKDEQEIMISTKSHHPQIVPLLLLTLPAVGQAGDYAYTTNNGTITVIKYTGRGGPVTTLHTITFG